MKLFWKIFTAVFLTLVGAVFIIAYFSTVKQIANAEQHLVGQYTATGDVLSREIEHYQVESRWPFERLQSLTKQQGFLFWWVVREDGVIHLADQAAMMGTNARDYFSQIKSGDFQDKDKVLLNRPENYGLFITPLEIGKKKWTFWLGFSLTQIEGIKKNIVLLSLLISMAAFLGLGVILYLVIGHFVKPIGDLTMGAASIGSGDLNHRVEIKSRDEIGQLANAFNQMAADLQMTTVSRDYMDSILETMSGALIVVDADANIVTTNRAACRILGYDQGELIGVPMAKILGQDQPLGPNLEKLIDQGELSKCEINYQTRDGQKVPVLFSGTVRRNDRGQITYVVCTAMDITAQKQIEDNLLKTKILSDTTIDSLPGVFYLFDHQGRFLRWNENFERASGYSAEEIAGMHPLDFFRGEDQKKVEERIKEAFVKGEISVEADLVSKDGRKTPHIFIGRRVTFDDTPYLIGTGIDISDLRLAVESLQESEQKYRLLVKTIPAVVFRGYVDWTVDFFDEKFEKLTGYAVEDFTSRRIKWSEMILPEDLARAKEIFKQALKTNRSYVREYRIKIRSGTIRWIRERGQISCDENGRVDYVTGMFSDNTKEHEMELALERLRLQNEMILNSAGEGIFGLDRRGKATFINPAALSLTGYEPKEVLGQNLHMLIHHQKPNGVPYPEEECPIYQTIRDGKRRQISDDLFWTKEGKPLPVEYVTTPIKEGGQVVGAVGVFRDITERKQAEEALRRSEENLRQSQKMEAVGCLAGGVAHDFNNLLTAIIGYGELLQMKFEPGDPRLNDMEDIGKAAERAACLTRQLLAFSRKQIFAPKVLDLNDLVPNLDKMLQRLISEDIELVPVLGKNLGEVMADPGQIEQAIINLVVNARDAMPRGGVISIETQNITLDTDYAQKYGDLQPGDYVRLAVSDTGAGMDKASLARIFEPFFTTKELGKGTGLGLSTVHGIVKQSGGHITVYSEVGQGTTFKIYLPRLSQPTAAAPPIPLTCPLDRGVETILLVEDEDIVRQVARRILEMNGYNVLEAASGREALLMSEQTPGPIHLMLTDVVMPGMSGGETAENLHAKRPDMKVLFMSGHTENSIVHHGVLDPGVSFIQKPFRKDLLVHKVRQVLDARPLFG